MGEGAGGLQVVSSLAGAGSGLAGSIAQAEAARAQSESNRSALRMQKLLAEEQARDAIRRGRSEEIAQDQATRRAIGQQRAALAAQGISVDAGSAFDVQSDTRAFGALQAATIRNNAAREALGFSLTTSELQRRLDIEKIAGKRRERATLVTGGLAFLRQTTGAVSKFAKERRRTNRQRDRVSRDVRDAGRAAFDVTGDLF